MSDKSGFLLMDDFVKVGGSEAVCEFHIVLTTILCELKSR